MKHFRLIVAFFLLIGLVGASAPLVRAAETNQELTDAKTVQIRTRCSTIQTTLGRIHANDALLRVNQGQLYDKLSTKLMAPFNSRLALNRLDGTNLVAAASNYEKHLSTFRSSYQTYEVTLSDLLRVDCKKQPAKFYDGLQQARSERADVKKATEQLADDITSYKKAFTSFATPYREGKL